MELSDLEALVQAGASAPMSAGTGDLRKEVAAKKIFMGFQASHVNYKQAPADEEDDCEMKLPDDER